MLATEPRSNGSNAPRDATVLITFTEPVDVAGAWFDITCAISGQHNSATTAIDGLDHYITPNVNFGLVLARGERVATNPTTSCVSATITNPQELPTAVVAYTLKPLVKPGEAVLLAYQPPVVQVAQAGYVPHFYCTKTEEYEAKLSALRAYYATLISNPEFI